MALMAARRGGGALAAAEQAVQIFRGPARHRPGPAAKRARDLAGLTTCPTPAAAIAWSRPRGRGSLPGMSLAMASELLAWTAMLALNGPARAWEPKCGVTRHLSSCGWVVRRRRAPGPRRPPPAAAPWASQLTTAITHLQALAPG